MELQFVIYRVISMCLTWVRGGDSSQDGFALFFGLMTCLTAKLRWSKINVSGDIPPPRSHFGAAITGNKFFVFGGSGKGEQEKLNDLHLLDLGTIQLNMYLRFAY